MEILREKFIGMDSDTAISRAELALDNASELPSAGLLKGRTLAAGSLAWDISTGDIYGMNSQGSWVKQN